MIRGAPPLVTARIRNHSYGATYCLACSLTLLEQYSRGDETVYIPEYLRSSYRGPLRSQRSAALLANQPLLTGSRLKLQAGDQLSSTLARDAIPGGRNDRAKAASVNVADLSRGSAKRRVPAAPTDG